MTYQRRVRGYRDPNRKRAIVAVQVAALMVALLGFAALTVDVGALYNAKADLQRTADAAALAAAGRLSDWSNGSPIELAKAAAIEYTASNKVLGQDMVMDPDVDVEFGQATFNDATGEYVFTPGNNIPDAVRIRVRKTSDSVNGAFSLYFARIFGMTESEIFADATAVMVPRDIAVVADLSGSHNDDSEFRNYQDTQINNHEVWGALPGGVGDVDSLWDPAAIPPEWVEPDGSIPQAAGPAWGFMQETGYGEMNVGSSYNPAADPGLTRLAYNQNWNNAQLEASLYDQGYIQSEVDAMMSNSYDSNGAYKYRVAVALGLAVWTSGHPGGLWEQMGIPPAESGNGNNWVGSGETMWTETIFGNTLAESSSLWLDYINNYMNKTWTRLYKANNAFKYQFGAKTFTNYLLERKYSNASTPELADVPAQPMQAVKDAVNFMTSMISDLDTDDQLSLEVYGTTARHEVDLTRNHTEVGNRLANMQAGHYDGWTNMGGGLERAIEELSSVRARGTSRRMIILLTDGNANVTASGQVNNYSGGAAYALEQAQRAADAGIRIFAVSVGAGANTSLMAQIAEIGQGEQFHAAGSIEEYSAQLTAIFQRIGGTRPVEIIR